MKTIIIICIIALSILQKTFCQNYNLTAVQGAHWIVRLDLMETVYPVDGLWEYYANGDTLINGKDYKKIYYRTLSITQYGPPFQASGIYALYGFLRDDSLNKKVYAIELNYQYKCSSNEEYLLFDFNLQIGDTSILCIRPEPENFIVQDVFSSNVFGLLTKTFTDYYGDNLYEGIGTDYGLFEQMYAPFKKSSKKYILHTFLYYYCHESPCSVIMSNTGLIENSAISIVPNPMADYFSIVGVNLNDINTVEIYNQLGQKEMHIEYDQKTIDVSKLKCGLYTIVLRTKNSYITKKIIIE